MNKNFYITTPIYYPSAEFHIGHCYTTIIADSIARYKRLSGYDVYFQTGTDEHGLKIETKAKEKGVTPKQYTDEIIENAKDLWKSLGISYDYFIRTTDEDHKEKVQKIFNKLYEQGDIYKSEYKGLYCVPCESFWTSSQLVEGKCPDCNRSVELVKEESYFFKLSKYQEKLEKFYMDNPEFLLPFSRKNEMLNNFIKPGLEDLCVSRTSFKWGIPVTFDPEHVIYVWIDALTNYITSLGYPDNLDKFNKYWPADLHLVGKEIVRFHAIIWPALLLALDLPLPKQVFGHGWLIIDGDKISKSKGNYKDPREYLKEYGVDAVRYFALREVSFGNDGNFSEKALITRTNGDLVNVLGNLVSRTIQMAIKYFDGNISNKNVVEDIDTDLLNSKNSLLSIVDEKMKYYKVNEALDVIFDVLRKCNKYIDETTPWLLAKDDSKIGRLETVLYNLLDTIRVCAVILQAFIPETAEKILSSLDIEKANYENLYDIVDNYSLGLEKPKNLFDRINEE